LLTKENILNTTSIDLSHLSKGLYVVQINGSKGRYVTKLLIE
jgi:Secretion system C-terminal sorting domain